MSKRQIFECYRVNIDLYPCTYRPNYTEIGKVFKRVLRQIFVNLNKLRCKEERRGSCCSDLVREAFQNYREIVQGNVFEQRDNNIIRIMFKEHILAINRSNFAVLASSEALRSCIVRQLIWQ